MKELVEFLVKSLVDNPEEVSLEEKEEDDSVHYELKVAQDDVGRIIGKHGSTINAIRTVVQAVASSRNVRSRLDVLG